MESFFLEQWEQIQPDFRQLRYVVAVSGGVDSMLLADLMCRVFSPHQLVLAHFNHDLRGEESAQDLTLVASFAERKGIAFESGRRQGAQVSEAALREERFEFLEKIRQKHQCDFIVLAHHLQDQLETFLMRLLRGTGLDGLTVMQPKKGFLIRPLLKLSKEAILAEAHKTGIEYREDRSNFETKYFRNQVRLRLLPEMEKLSAHYGGKEKWMQRLPFLFEELSWAKKELDRHGVEKWADFLVETPFWIRLNQSQFQSLTRFQQNRLVREPLNRFGVEPFSQKEMRLMMSRLDKKVKRFSSPGIDIVSSCGYLYFARQGTLKSMPTLKFVKKRGVVECPVLEMRLRVNSKVKDVQWRQYVPGDRFQGKKLKEYFLETRVPMPERPLIPVLAKKNSHEVLWAFPQRSDLCAVELINFPFAVK